jgi:hypothetical protein
MTYLSFGLPKTISPQNFLTISLIFSNCFKAFSNLNIEEDFKRKKNKHEKEMGDLFLET